MNRSFLGITIAAFFISTSLCAQEIGGDIFTAIHLNDVSAVRSMIADDFTGTRNARRDGGISPLHYAVKMNRLEIINLLLRSGMPVDLITDQMLTPLHWAADSGRTDCLRLLLKRNANIEAKAKNGWTPLHFTARRGNTETAKYLIESGAVLDAKDAKGNTPLFYAVAADNAETVELLISSGASVVMTNLGGLQPADVAKGEAVRNMLQNAGGRITKKGSAGVAVRSTVAAKQSASQVKPSAKTERAFANAEKPVSVKQPVAKPVSAKALPATARVAAKKIPQSQTLNTVKPKAPAVQGDTSAPVAAIAPVAEAPVQVPSYRESTVPLTAPLGREAAVTRTSSATVPSLVAQPVAQNSAPVSALVEPRTYNPNYRTIPMADGSVYNGELRRDKFHGRGTLDYPDGQQYDGTWSRGRKSGTGTFKYANGDKYTGEWRKDVPHGKGLFEYANGGRIDGVWSSGIMKSGRGVYFSADGVKYWGMWENNELKQTHPIE